MMRPSLKCIAACCGILFATNCPASTRQADRALTVLRTDGEHAFASWRWLSTDAPETTFAVELGERPEGPFEVVNESPDATNTMLSVPAGKTAYVRVRVQSSGSAFHHSPAVAVPINASDYLSIPLGTQDGAQKVGLGDFDGDGRLDYLVKTPNFNVDPYQGAPGKPAIWRRSRDAYKLTAIRHDGTRLWTHDMGWSIEQGIWYSPVIVCDLDGDGIAEVFCKAGEGDLREPTGQVLRGPEWLIMLDGRTGEMRKRLPWPDRDGFNRYGQASRNLMGVARLDGKRSHLVVVRGTYDIIKVQAYTPELEPLWYWEAEPESGYLGQGMHGLHAADVDGDGHDEIILGSAVLDDDGTPLWTTGKGHPDVCYVADFDPERSGLEIFYGIEPRSRRGGVALHDARTGEEIWAWEQPTFHVHGQGMVGDLIAEEPGIECYAGEAKGGEGWWLYTAKGRLVNREDLGELSPKAIYWLDGTAKVYVSKDTVYRWPREPIGRIDGGQIIAIADFLGDWREEVIVTAGDELRIYTTIVPTRLRRTWLMEDPLYRNDVTMQTMGYFYPPQLSKW